MTPRTQQTHPRRWLLPFLAALIAALAAILSGTTASATPMVGAETRVGAFNVAGEVLVGPPQHVSAGQSLREQVAAYLRSGTVVLALMEHTRDVIDGSFGTPGGSGLLTDGTYYWRADAADYVEHHGVAVEEEALEWMERHAWQAPAVSPDALSRIDAELFERLRS
ncbi:MAG: hypothetical protein R2734_08950 [Nocardioides sp.]